MQSRATNISIKNKLEHEKDFKISRFKEVIKRTKPHKHESYFELIYLSQGAGFHYVDTQKFQITPPAIFILSGQLHYWEMTAIPKGFVLLFREDFLMQKHLIDLAHQLETIVYAQPSDDDNLDFIFEELEKEYQRPKTASPELIRGYLQVVFVKLMRHKDYSRTAISTGGPQIFRQFQQFIRGTNPISNLKVNDVADSLGVSPQNLSSICRKVSGKSASELIVEQVILEAKRYLLHSDTSVSGIALALNFADASHFVKYFKKATGETPQAFRSRYFNNTTTSSHTTIGDS